MLSDLYVNVWVWLVQKTSRTAMPAMLSRTTECASNAVTCLASQAASGTAISLADESARTQDVLNSTSPIVPLLDSP